MGRGSDTSCELPPPATGVLAYVEGARSGDVGHFRRTHTSPPGLSVFALSVEVGFVAFFGFAQNSAAANWAGSRVYKWGLQIVRCDVQDDSLPKSGSPAALSVADESWRWFATFDDLTGTCS